MMMKTFLMMKEDNLKNIRYIQRMMVLEVLQETNKTKPIINPNNSK